MSIPERNLKIAQKLFEVYCNTPHNLWGGFMHVNDYNQRRNLDLDEKFEEYQTKANRLLGWIPLNPSKSNCKEAIKNTYVSYDKGDAFPSTHASSKLLEYILGKEDSVIYLKGYRGSGKTAALNNFFNENHQKLNSKGITFFRCDARKIELIDKELFAKKVPANSPIKFDDFTEKISLIEYINAHNFYVALVHARNDSLLNGFRVRLVQEESIDIKSEDDFGFYLEQNGFKDQYSLWKEIVIAFQSSAILVNGSVQLVSGMTNFLAQIIDQCLRKSNAYENLVNSFHLYMRNRKNLNGTVLTIDGVDNYSRVATTGRNYYDNLLKQLQTYAVHDKSKRYKKIIISLRPESYHELGEQVAGGFSIGDKTFNVSTPKITELLDKRVKCANDAHKDQKSFFNFAAVTCRSNDLFVAFKYEIRLFLIPYINTFIEKNIAPEATHITNQDINNLDLIDNNASLILDILFSSNVRSMLRSLVASYAHCRQYYDKNVSKTTHPSFIKWVDNKYDFIFEGSLVLGRHVLWDDGSDSGPARRGNWCPPLFSYPIDLIKNSSDKDDAWFSLGLIRVLQYINYHKSSTEYHCIKEMTKLGYPERISGWFFGRALRYGLIQVNEKSVRKNHVPFHITKKGVYIVNKVLDEDTLVYYLGCATLYPRDVTKNDDFITLHTDLIQDERNLNFSEAVISVGTSLYRCLIEAHNREIKLLEENEANLNEKNNYFTFPKLSKISKKWANRLISLHKMKANKSQLTSNSPLITKFLNDYDQEIKNNNL